jgi:hypothetical protein
MRWSGGNEIVGGNIPGKRGNVTLNDGEEATANAEPGGGHEDTMHPKSARWTPSLPLGVEERAGERRRCARVGRPLSPSLSPLVPRRARESHAGSAQISPVADVFVLPAWQATARP